MSGGILEDRTLPTGYEHVQTFAYKTLGNAVFKVQSDEEAVEDNPEYYVIKRVSKNKRSGMSLKALQREIDILSTIRGLENGREFVCEFVREAGDNEYLYAVLKFVSGGTLQQYVLQNGRLDLLAVRDLMLALLSALEFLHENQIAHRDIKGANIMLSGGEDLTKVVLIDFDAAAKFAEKPFTKVIGTMLYVAPEVFKRNYDERCDIWSIGVLALRCLTSRLIMSIRPNEDFYSFGKRLSVDLVQQKLSTIFHRAEHAKYNEYFHEFFVEPERRLSISQYKERTREVLDENYSFMKGNAQRMLSYIRREQLSQILQEYACWVLMSSSDFERLSLLFSLIDDDGNGKLDFNEYKIYMEYCGFNFTDEELEERFRRIDTDHSGDISIVEFVNSVEDKQSILQQVKPSNVFDIIDRDNNGTITKAELLDAFQKVRPTLNEEGIDELLRSDKEDFSSGINREQFGRLFMFDFEETE